MFVEEEDMVLVGFGKRFYWKVEEERCISTVRSIWLAEVVPIQLLKYQSLYGRVIGQQLLQGCGFRSCELTAYLRI